MRAIWAATTFWLASALPRDAAPGRLLVSTLLHEEPEDAARTIKNLLQFTHPRTPIAVHYAAQRTSNELRELRAAAAAAQTALNAAAPGRVFFNPERYETAHGSGNITLGLVR